MKCRIIKTVMLWIMIICSHLGLAGCAAKEGSNTENQLQMEKPVDIKNDSKLVNENKQRLPNVVIIFADDLGYGDLGCYGSFKNKTPRLDKMASEGMRLMDFHVSSPVCSPSRSALMTGCYSQRVGLARGSEIGVLTPGDALGINSNETTLAELLKTKGYATACIGKWHLGDQPEFFPTKHGFDEYFGMPYSNDMRKSGKAPLPLMRNEEVIEWDPDQSTLTQRYTREAVEFITNHQGQPFFLYLPHMYVHLPLHPSKEFLDQSRNGAYGAEVECVDWSSGEILDTLAKLGLDENTIIIFSSDNGATTKNGSSNAPLRGAKATTWEGGMRVPFIIRWAGKIPAGSVCKELTTSMDIFPTVAALIDAKVPDDRIIDGKNIWSLLSGQDGAKSPHEVFYYYRQYNIEAIRCCNWKLHLKTNELYDLEKDIGEKINLFSKYPDVVKKLQLFAEKGREDLGDGARVGQNCRPAGRAKHPITLYERYGNSVKK